MKETPPKKNPEMNIYLTQYKLDGQFEWNEQVHHMALFDGKVYNVKLKDITDIIWNGHTHDSWSVRLSKARLTGKGTVHLDDVHHVSTPGYKDEFSPMEGWHVERGGPPKPIGAAWLRLSIEHHSKPNKHRRMKIEIREAT